VLAQLGLERGLQHSPGDLLQQAARADQRDPFGAGLLDRLVHFRH
jgi:hypothetical protein